MIDRLLPDKRAAEVNACCAALYESEWARLLFGGNAFHPGGHALTEQLGRLLGLDHNAFILDIACGRGASAIHLARTFGCRVVGVDLSAVNLAAARSAAAHVGLSNLLMFEQGDAEHLPFAGGAFDVAVCECSFCLFPNSAAAAAECARVLRPSGRVGLAELIRRGRLPAELETLAAWLSCIAGARELDGYTAALQTGGLAMRHVEAHDEALATLVRRIHLKLLGLEVLAKLGKVRLPPAEIERAKALAKAAATAVADGRLGYSLLVAERC
jgi:arsenite methyltransferase